MKPRLAVLLILAPAWAFAEGGDNQSIYQISGTIPLTVSGSTRIGPISNLTRAIRFAPKVDAHCRFGNSSVVATISDTLFFGYTPEYVKVQPTDGTYISCIQDSSAGLVYIDEMKP